MVVITKLNSNTKSNRKKTEVTLNDNRRSIRFNIRLDSRRESILESQNFVFLVSISTRLTGQDGMKFTFCKNCH